MCELQDRALNYLSSCIDQVHTFGDILQLVIVELIYKVPRFTCLQLYKHPTDCFEKCSLCDLPILAIFKVAHIVSLIFCLILKTIVFMSILGNRGCLSRYTFCILLSGILYYLACKVHQSSIVLVAIYW